MSLQVDAKRWSEEEDSILRERYATTSLEELAAILGRSYRSVAGRVNRIGLRRSRVWSATELAYLLEHRGSMPHAEIAQMLGVTSKAVSRAIERYGMQQHRRGLTEHQQRRFKNLHTRGYSDLKIARKIGLTKSRVLRHRLRAGLPGNGYTDKSWSAPARDSRRDALKCVAASKFGVRRVTKDELVELAMQFTEGDDEMLAVVWESMQSQWNERSTIADMHAAAQEGITQFRRETYSFMSADAFVDEDGRRLEMAEDRKLRAFA